MVGIKFFIIFVLISLVSAQNYLMEVVQYNIITKQTTFRCAGALTTNTNIIVPANCLDDIPEHELFIRTRIIYTPNASSTSLRPVSEGYRQHLNYNRSDTSKNNIAFINYLNLESAFAPRNLSQILETPSQCFLHGLLARNRSNIAYHDDPVTILSPEQCLSEDSHTYCAVFESSITNPTCDFDFGSPITCDGITVAGFLANGRGCTTNWVNDTGTLRQAPMLKFTSMSLYHEWMALEEEMTTTSTTTQAPTTPDSATSVQLAKLGILTAVISLILVNFRYQ